MIRGLRELNYELWSAITRLYSRSPLRHCYLMYDVLYELEATEAFFLLKEGEIEGYVLVWRGGSRPGIHVWGHSPQLTHLVPLERGAVVQVYSEQLVKPLLAKARGRAEVRWYLDMVVDEESFRPYLGVEAVRLTPAHTEHLSRLSTEWARPLSPEEARRLLKKWRWYGVFEGGELASVAAAYLRLPEVWVIGGVYTRTAFRGRGYAKAVTTAITRDAVRSGAKALLHVAEDNKPARRVYATLGYQRVARRPWIFMQSPLKAIA
ncbi:MAG: hypothetical protein DRK00_04940 [Thermoprotei archaeon]|nr:MAG: hypothetical protein DRK00_04940 [Thermoprotei archaeon]